MNRHLSHPYPLGATLDNNGCNFSIYAPDCSLLLLALFDEHGHYITHELTHEYAGIKYIHLAGIKAGQRYGYIIQHNKELHYIADPYAKALDGCLSYQPPLTSTKSFELPKGVVISHYFDWQNVPKPMIPIEDTIVFEMHVKGVTQLHDDIPEHEKGSYLGLISEPMLAFYRQQKINTIQLLPVASCMHEPHLLEAGNVNYWGYNPYLFMAPDPRYARHDAVTELKTVIRELHRHGIEVILDVVYNHTAEGDENGPFFNLKALNSNYYLAHNHHYANFTGCGNTLDLTHQASLNLVMDTLRYWVKEYQVDGFRFDLASTLGRIRENFSQESPFFKAVAQDPVLKQVKLIAEPWDIGPNGYQVGNFPFGWNECNDRLRDVFRSFWRGDHGYLKEFATRLMGSRDLYSASKWPYKLTVNYITYHDGFTLQDLVSYKEKHNQANGEENRDGHSDNRSDNYGIEGDTDNIKIHQIREKQKRNLIASLLFSFGIPHILTADLLSHTQRGNNNAYCQDNEISWLNWSLDDNKTQFKQWVSEMITARRTYMMPFMQAFSGKSRNSNRIAWRRVDGINMEYDDWNRFRSVALHMGIGDDGAEILYLINQSEAPARFKLPNKNEQKWTIIFDTHLPDSKKTRADIEEEALDSIAGEHLQHPVSMSVFYYQP